MIQFLIFLEVIYLYKENLFKGISFKVWVGTLAWPFTICMNLVRVCAWLHTLCLDSLWPHELCLTRLFCPWDSPGKVVGVGCHFLLQGIFSPQRSNVCLLHWQVHSLPLSHVRSPVWPKTSHLLKVSNFQYVKNGYKTYYTGS